jgi:hypothetical protein
VWAAATYALIPVATGAIAAGRLGTATAFALVPVICLLAGRMLTKAPRLARRAAWATGLAIAVGAAFVPLLWLIALLALIPAAVVLRSRPAMLRNLGIVALVPPVLLVPWTFQFIAHPSTLLLEAGNQQAGLASPDLPARSLMLLSPGGPGLPSVYVTAGLALAALVALLASRRRPLVMSGWLVALLGLLVAALTSRLSVQPAGGGAPVTVWPGVALAVTAAGLLLAAAAGGDSLGALLAGGRSGLRRIASPRGLAVGLLAVVACSAPVLAAASWLRDGVSGPVGPASGQVVPALVSVSAANGQHPRTLVLRSVGGQVSYQLLRGSGPALGDADLIPVPGAERALRTAVASLVAPAGGLTVNQGELLAHFDIAFVLMRAPVSPGLARTLDGIAGLRPVSTTAKFALWRLTTMPSRVSVTEPDGTVVPVPSGQVSVSGTEAPTAGGTLTVAEPTGGWHATLNGHPLTVVPSPAGSWAQAFRLPSGGGTLDISHGELGHDLAITFELLAALVVAALALPGVRPATEARVAAEAAAAAGLPDGSAPAGDGADPATGTAAGGPAGRAAGEAARRGGKGRSRGRGLGRRGKRPDGDETLLPGAPRPRPGVSSGPGGRPGGVTAGAAAGAGAGLAAGSARLGARPSRRDAARAGAGPEGADGMGAGGMGPDGMGPDGTGADGRGAGRGGAGRGGARRGGAGRGADGSAAERGAFDRGAPGRAAAVGATGPDQDWADPAAAEWGDPAAAGRSGRPGGRERTGREPDGREPVGREPGGRVPGGQVPDPGIAGPPRRDSAVRSPTGAWPYPDDATQVAAPPADAGSRRGARPDPAAGPAYADRQDYPGQPGVPGTSGSPRGAQRYAPEPARAADDNDADLRDMDPRSAGGRGADPRGADPRGAGRPYPGQASARPSTPTGNWTPAGPPEPSYDPAQPSYDQAQPSYNRAEPSYDRAEPSYDPAEPPYGGPRDPGRRDPGRPGPASREPDWQEAGYREPRQRPPAGRPEPPPASGWPQQDMGPSWPDSEPAPSPGSEQPSSWPTYEQPSSWPAPDQPAGWPGQDQPSWSGGGQAPEWPAGSAAAVRQASAYPQGGQGYGGESQWQPEAPQPYGQQPGAPQPGAQPGWAGSGDSLEPLPSSDLHHAGPGHDERARRRWPAPEGDDVDERDAW